MQKLDYGLVDFLYGDKMRGKEIISNPMTGTLYNIDGGKIYVHGTTAGSFLIENGQEEYQLVLVVTNC